MGKRCFQEPPRYLFVVGPVNGEVEQIIFAEEAVEDVGGKHQRWRHSHPHAWKLAFHSPPVQQVANECQSARFAAQRTPANLQKR